MACNMYRALLEEYSTAGIDGIRQTAYLLDHALGYAPTFNGMDYYIYCRIVECCRNIMTEVDAMENDPDFPEQEMHMRKLELRDGLREVIMQVLPKIGKEWLDLGMPETSESWIERKYGGNDEN